MKKTLKSAMIILLSLGMLLSLCSCRMVEGYKRFNIKNITDNPNDDYFTSENLSFARIQDVVFIPEIKAANHDGYTFFVYVYSISGSESVQINNVFLKENDTALLAIELGESVEFEKTEENYYRGRIIGGTFAEETLNVASGKTYELVIEVEVISDGTQVSKSISYEVDVKGYKTHVTPT